jgi:hypothetical protein
VRPRYITQRKPKLNLVCSGVVGGGNRKPTQLRIGNFVALSLSLSLSPFLGGVYTSRPSFSARIREHGHYYSQRDGSP